MLHLQGNMRRFNLVANYQLSKAQTWGCLLGDYSDYVDGGLSPRAWANRMPDSEMPSDRRLRPSGEGTFFTASFWPAQCTYPAVLN